MSEEFRNKVIIAARKRILYLPHALDQMNRPERLITPKEVKRVIFDGEIIENYPEDSRGHSCLIFGFGNEARPVHVVCSPKEDSLALITAYLPDKDKWCTDFKTRL